MIWKYVLFEEVQDSCNEYIEDTNNPNPNKYAASSDYALKFNTPDEATEYRRNLGEHFDHYRIEAIPVE